MLAPPCPSLAPVRRSSLGADRLERHASASRDRENVAEVTGRAEAVDPRVVLVRLSARHREMSRYVGILAGAPVQLEALVAAAAHEAGAGHASGGIPESHLIRRLPRPAAISSTEDALAPSRLSNEWIRGPPYLQLRQGPPRPRPGSRSATLARPPRWSGRRTASVARLGLDNESARPGAVWQDRVDEHRIAIRRSGGRGHASSVR
jgi:hypothetical protein